jgi:hypothetical protein
VNYAILMKEANRGNDAFHDGSGLALGEKLLSDNFIEQFSAFHQLEDQIYTLFRFESIPKRYNVWMLACG